MVAENSNDQVEGEKFSPALKSVTLGAQSELLSRVAKKPLDFSFAWRGKRFRGKLEANGERTRLALFAELGIVPYSAEGTENRRILLAIVDALKNKDSCRLRMVKNQTVVQENEVSMPISSGCTIKHIIANITTMVLETAPFLDLMAEVLPVSPTPNTSSLFAKHT